MGALEIFAIYSIMLSAPKWLGPLTARLNSAQALFITSLDAMGWFAYFDGIVSLTAVTNALKLASKPPTAKPLVKI